MPFRTLNLDNKWAVHLLDSNVSYSNYATACMCPCFEIRDIAKLLISSENTQHAHGISCIALAVASIAVDMPICFCLDITRARVLEDYDVYSENEDSWDPSTSSYDWWPLSWCSFYSLAAMENCCSSLCCGPKIRMSSFPLSFALCLSCIYPICICPISCVLREGAKEKLHIQNESCIETCLKSTCCTPFSLVQVRKTLESFPPSYVNSMQ